MERWHHQRSALENLMDSTEGIRSCYSTSWSRKRKWSGGNDLLPLPAIRTRMLSGLSAQNILTNEERREMLAKAGVDNLLECPFVPEIAHMEPERFIEEVLVGQLKMKFAAVGNRFSFWISAAREIMQCFRKLAPKYGYIVEVVEKEQSHGRDISSTYIRGSPS